MSFDEWFNSHEDRKEWDDAPPIAVDAFEAGQQSQQAEVDELQKRIEDAIEKIESFDRIVDVKSVYEILKGD